MQFSTQIEDNIKCTFVSLGCNREPSAIAWNHELNLIAYAGSSLVAVYNPHPSVNSLLGTLRGHSKDVTVTRWMPQPSIDPYNSFHSSDVDYTPSVGQVISAGFDGRIMIWDVINTSAESSSSSEVNASKFTIDTFSYRIAGELVPPAGYDSESVTNIDAMYANHTTVVVALRANGDVQIYTKHDSTQQWTCAQCIGYPPHHLMQAVAMTTFTLYNNQQCVLLALAGVDGTVHIHASLDLLTQTAEGLTRYDMDYTTTQSHDTTDPLFFVLGSLQGHRDWVRSLDFCHVPSSTGTQQHSSHDVLLASGSQDKTARVWRFSIPSLDVLYLLSRKDESSRPPTTTATATDTSSSPTHTDTATHSTDNTTTEIGNEHTHEKVTLDTTIIASSSLGENGQLFFLSPSYMSTLAVTLETVLIGHEDWVVGVQWKPSPPSPATAGASSPATTVSAPVKPQSQPQPQPLTLLTVSTDHSLSEWSPRPASYGGAALWNCTNRIGDGNAYLCYYGGSYGPHGQSIIAVTFNGAISMWCASDSPLREHWRECSDAIHLQPGNARRWIPVHCPTGHQSGVVDVICCYNDDPTTLQLMAGFAQANLNQQANPFSHPPLNKNTLQCTSPHYVGPQLPYIITASSDQTCRVYSPLVAKPASPQTDSTPVTHTPNDPLRPTMTLAPWYEIARSQIHGWDMVSLASMACAGQFHQYMSCAEEKVIRVFRSPSLFIAALYKLSSDLEFSSEQLAALLKLTTTGIMQDGDDGNAPQTLSSSHHHTTRALCAMQSKLGLSNKPIMEGDDVTTQTELQSVFDEESTVQTMSIENSLAELKPTPPVEETLATRTLWSEVDKLYGHGYDLVSIASGHTTPMMLSSSNARSAKNAVIRLWNAHTLKEEQLLYAHQSTVVQIVVSAGNTIARDYAIRKLYLEQKLKDVGLSDPQREEINTQLQHPRLLAHCSPAMDPACDRFIATVGRDMQLALFRRNVSDVESQQHRADGTIPPYVLCSITKAHSRQLFGLTFCGSDNLIATIGRDKLLKLWTVQNKNTMPKLTAFQTIKLPQPKLMPSAIASTNTIIDGVVYIIIAVGCEDGTILLYRLQVPFHHDHADTNTTTSSTMVHFMDAYGEDIPLSTQCELHGVVNPHSSHSMAVTRIVFFPRVADEKQAFLTVAQDHSTRMWLLDW